nr:ribonuclease H-like domain-containing protein [Tanacetum cinerariifolium]
SFHADEEPTIYALMAFTSSSLTSSSGFDNEVAPCSKACSKAYATFQSHYDKLTVDLRKTQFDVLSYKTGLESVEARLVVYQHNENVFEEDIKLLKLDVMLRDNALVELRKKFKIAKKERDELKLTLENFQTSSKNLSKRLESQIIDKTRLGYDNQVFNSTVFDCDELTRYESDVSVHTSLVYDRYQTAEGYHLVPPLCTGTFMPPKPDLVFHDAWPSAPIIEDWVFDLEDESEDEPMPTQKAPSFVQISEHVKTPRTFVKPECDYYEKKMVQKPIWNHEMRINHHNSARMTHPHSKRHVVPTAVLTRAIHNKLYRIKMCDKKNSVLFIDTECVVLSSDFKLPEENHVLLRVRRENNMYNVDLKNIAPSGDLTCLFTKATLDKSNLWHRRLGHIDFKIMNKHVKDADDAFDIKENVSKVHVSPISSDKIKKHDEKEKRKAKGNSHVELSIRVRDLNDEFEEFYVNSTYRVNVASPPVTAVGPNSTNSTNNFNATDPSDNAEYDKDG